MRFSRKHYWLAAAILVLVGVGLVAPWLVDLLYRHPADYTLLEPGLYLGGRVDQPPPDARAVLNLRQQADPYAVEVHRWRPIPDGPPAPSLAWLGEQVQFLAEQRRQGHTVFVHCDAGVSRSAMVVVAYLMWRDHLPRDAALARVRAKRPQAKPNAAFMDLLARWQGANATQ